MKIFDNQYLCFLPNVISVKGYNRSSILDLYARRIHLVPNGMIEFLEENDFLLKPLLEILNRYGEEDKHVLFEYCTFLVGQDLAFLGDEHDKNQLSSFPIDWHPDSKLETVIIELDNQSAWNVSSFLERINRLGVKFMEIRFLDYTSFKINIEEIKKGLENHSVETVDLFVPYTLSEVNHLEEAVSDFYRMNRLVVYNAKQGFEFKDLKINVFFTRQPSVEAEHCGNISMENFTISTPTYVRNRNQNSCLSHKLSVNKKGKLKNCPSFNTSFGNVDTVMIGELIEKEDFNDSPQSYQ